MVALLPRILYLLFVEITDGFFIYLYIAVGHSQRCFSANLAPKFQSLIWANRRCSNSVGSNFDDYDDSEYLIDEKKIVALYGN